MATASTSKVKLDGEGLLYTASSNELHADDSNGQDHHRNVDDDEDDDDNDGFVTPTLPPTRYLNQILSPSPPTGHPHESQVSDKEEFTLALQSQSPEATSKEHFFDPESSPFHPSEARTKDSLFDSDSSHSPSPPSDGPRKTLTMDSSVEEVAPFKTKKRRGRPPGSKNKVPVFSLSPSPSESEPLASGSSSSKTPIVKSSKQGGRRQKSKKSIIAFSLSPSPSSEPGGGYDGTEDLKIAFGSTSSTFNTTATYNNVTADLDEQIEMQEKEIEVSKADEEGWEDQEDDERGQAEDEEDDEEEEEEEVKEEEEDNIMKYTTKKKRKASPKRPLHQDFVFEPPSEAMFAELRAFLDREDGQSSSSSSDDEQEQGEGTEEMYEQRRLKKLRANEAILSKLGLGALSASSPKEEIVQDDAEESPMPYRQPPRGKGGIGRSTKYQRTQLRVDVDGTTTSLPLPGCTTEFAYVDVPTLRDRIRLQHLYFDDVPIMPPKQAAVEESIFEEEEGEEGSEYTASPSKRAKDDSPKKKIKKRRSTLNHRRGPRGEAVDGEGTTCHQCRRKTVEAKMRCRFHENGKVCTLYWCRRCLDVRYGIEMDPESRTFECPRCLAYCNCSICLRKAGLDKFVPESINMTLAKQLQDEDGIQLYRSVKHYIDEKVGRSVKIGNGGLLTGQKAAKEAKEAKEKKKKEKVAKEKKVKTSVKGVKKNKKATKGEAADADPVTSKKRRRTKKDAGTSGDLEQEADPHLASNEDTSAKKIRLTWKRKAEQSPELQVKKKTKKEEKASETKATKKVKARPVPVQQPVNAVFQSKKSKSAAAKANKLNPPQRDNIWVRSKADAMETSSSVSGESDLTSLSDEEAEEAEEEVEGYEGLMDEGGNSTRNHEHREVDDASVDSSDYYQGDEDPGEDIVMQTSSPLAGQVEYSTHPSMPTLEDYQSTTIDTHFTEQSSDSLPAGVDNLVDGFTYHYSQDMAMIMNQLREAGYV